MSQIKIGGTLPYTLSVMDVLKAIRRNRVGNIIASNIEALDKDLVIVPFDASHVEKLGECNASAREDNLRDAAPKGISGNLVGESAWYQGKEDDPRTLQDERYDRRYGIKGTGEGSDVHIYFSPETQGKSGCGGGVYGSLSDEVLLHEMVHALRQMQGRNNPVPTEGSVREYDNEEEFLAIVVTNVYMSASLEFHGKELA
jgi:Effector protein